MLDDEGVPELPDDDRARINEEIVAGRGAMTPDGARRLLEVTLRHPQVRFVVSALGAPPPDVVEKLRAHDITIGAMCGRPKHAARHKAAGVDVIIAQGTEAGGHTGEIATLVLVPQVIDAVGRRRHPGDRRRRIRARQPDRRRIGAGRGRRVVRHGMARHAGERADAVRAPGLFRCGDGGRGAPPLPHRQDRAHAAV